MQPELSEFTQADLDRFWRSHYMCRDVAQSALDYLGPKGNYDAFVKEMKKICYAYCGDPNLQKLPETRRPDLRLVTSK